jgi:hypothetical protein
MPGHALVADALRHDRHALGDQQAGRGALGVVVGHQGVGDLGRTGPQAGQRRHDDAVGQLQVAETKRIEQSGHEAISERLADPASAPRISGVSWLDRNCHRL